MRVRRRAPMPGSPISKPLANVTTVGQPRPSSYVQRGLGLYVPPNWPQNVDEERYRQVPVNLYLNGDQRSGLVIDRYKPTPLYRRVLRP